jgi:hypothetical protein
MSHASDGRSIVATLVAVASLCAMGATQELLYTPSETLTPAAGTTLSGAVLLGDATGDGWPDLVYGEGFPTSRVTLLAGSEGGGFTPLPPSDLPGLGVVRALVDLDGDGDGDLLATGTGSFPHVVVVALHDGEGGFAGPTGTPAFTTSSSVRVAAGDIDGDGVPDLACTTPYLQVLRGVGDGSFTLAQTFNVPPGAPAIVGLDVADVDEDGRTDVLVSLIDGTTRIHLGQPGGQLDFDPVLVGMSSGSVSSRGVALADLDGDGHLDLAVADADASRLGVRLGAGDGSFGPLFVGASLVDVPNGVSVADVDDDGVPDALVRRAGTYVTGTRVLLGQGDGSFGPGGGTASALTGPLPVAVDVDGDGRRDLVAFEKTGCATMRDVTPGGRAPWANLGGSLHANGGYPVLIGTGVLLPGAPWSLLVGNGWPGAQPLLVVGLGGPGLPFKGGTLWPTPDLILTAPAFDADGLAPLAGTWPTLPGGLSIWLQAWLVDGTAAQGYGASNGLRADVP